MRERVFSRKVLLVRVSIKCCITSDAETSRTSVFITLKAKNITLLIQKGRRKFSQPFKTQGRFMLLLQSAEKRFRQIAIGFELTSDCSRKLPGVFQTNHLE